MIISNAKYTTDPMDSSRNVAISATIDGKHWSVVVPVNPEDEGHYYYAEIMRQVEAGELTIEETDTKEE